MFHESHSIVVGRQVPIRWTKCEFCEQCTCHDAMRMLEKPCPGPPGRGIMPKKFQLQVIDVEAIQVTPDRVSDAVLWCGGVLVTEKDALNPDVTYVAVNVPTENDIQRAQEGDYIVKDNYGNFHVVKKEKFEAHFKRVDENPEG